MCIKYSIEYHITYYMIHIDRNTDKEYLEANIFKLANKLKDNLKMYNFEIIKPYTIKIY